MGAGSANSSIADKTPDAQNSAIDAVLRGATRFAASWVGAFSTYCAAVVLAVVGLQQLPAKLGLPVSACAGIVATPLVLTVCFHTLPALLERWRKEKLKRITGSGKPGYFQLGPREDEASFQRADGKHDEVLAWLRGFPRRVLYLTGTSGAGKSSLMSSWVLPKLKREGVRIIPLRGYQEPARALEEELKRLGSIWKRNPPETDDLTTLLEEARKRLAPVRLLIVLDQFEEFLILRGGPEQARFVEFLMSQVDRGGGEVAILLIFRAEYDGFISELKLPVPIPGVNLQKVSVFTEAAARDFLDGSGLFFDQRLLAVVLREAAEVEGTKGLIRPVTVNLCGLVLSRFATGLPRQFRPGRLIRGFVHESIFQKEIADVSPVLLPRLISEHVTKRPQSIEELAAGSGLTKEQAQGTMFKLEEPERAIVRRLNEEGTVWEISHDFLVPIIDSFLAQWMASFWRTVRPWLPAACLAVLLLVILATRWMYPDPIAELTRLGWTATGEFDTKAGRVVSYRLSYGDISASFPPAESTADLERIRTPMDVDLSELPAFDASHFGEWDKIAHLTSLTLRGLSPRTRSTFSGVPLMQEGRVDFSVIHKLTHLTSLRIDDWTVSDSDLARLPGSLQSLNAEGDTITDSGLKYLPGTLKELTLFSATNVTDAGLKNLPKTLTDLSIWNAKITDAGLKDLPGTLIDLSISDAKITDAGLKDLPPRLEHLNLSKTMVTREGVKSLPPTVQVYVY